MKKLAVIFAICLIALSCDNYNSRGYFDTVVEFTNGDTMTVVVYGLKQPYLTEKGCVYDGYSYICGVRRVVSFIKNKKK